MWTDLKWQYVHIHSWFFINCDYFGSVIIIPKARLDLCWVKNLGYSVSKTQVLQDRGENESMHVLLEDRVKLSQTPSKSGLIWWPGNSYPTLAHAKTKNASYQLGVLLSIGFLQPNQNNHRDILTQVVTVLQITTVTSILHYVEVQ